MQDLNNLIGAGTGWTLSIAYGINDAGQIVAGGIKNGVLGAARLDPQGVAIANLTTLLSSHGLGLSSGSVDSLTAKLQAALTSIAQGNPRPAANQLNAFIDEIQALENSRRLSAQAAAPLITAVNDIRASL